jgi:hypothetical protein
MKKLFGISLIEYMLVFAIILTVATPILRIYYHDEIQAFGRKILLSLGIDPDVVQIVWSVVIICALPIAVVYVIRKRLKK